ncbi:MAG: hypothetical protein ABH826_00210 [Patescibacteria group bacterium]
MADLSNQQFYEYNAPGEMPGKKFDFSRTLKIFIPILIIVVSVVFVVAVMNIIQNNRTAQDLQDLQDSADTMIDRATVDCSKADDPELCQSRAFAEVARETGLAAMCEQVNEDAKRSCVTSIAFDQANPNVCRILTADDKQKCEDLAWLSAAQRNVNLENCEKISDESTQTSCETNVIQMIQTLGKCDSYNIDESLCESYSAIYDAATGDPAVCRALDDSAAVNACLDLITTVDQDFDGLSAFDEFLLGTSDTNIDSDGDGFDDATEYINNFDPTL